MLGFLQDHVLGSLARIIHCFLIALTKFLIFFLVALWDLQRSLQSGRLTNVHYGEAHPSPSVSQIEYSNPPSSHLVYSIMKRQSFDNSEASISYRFHANSTTWQAPGQASSCLYRALGRPAPCGTELQSTSTNVFTKLIIQPLQGLYLGKCRSNPQWPSQPHPDHI